MIMDIVNNAADMIKRCINVAKKAQKPSNTELNRIAKVSALLIVITGVIGVIISLLLGLL